jgi:hypothetical protein
LIDVPPTAAITPEIIRLSTNSHGSAAQSDVSANDSIHECQFPRPRARENTVLYDTGLRMEVCIRQHGNELVVVHIPDAKHILVSKVLLEGSKNIVT